ncbi:MAG TPA: DoxX family protein [Pseudolabrys sp.]|nr:DoxX family protein [Pseudolabrys sp.]
MLGSHSAEPKLFFPGLAGFYATVSDLWYPMLRITAGATLFMHGWAKLHSGAAPVIGSMVKAGLTPPTAFAYFTIFLETVGAICIVLGLFTRLFAAAIAIEMAIICFVVMMPAGYYRMEATLIWGILFFAIALRGGGPYSLDRAIGKEL